VVQEIGRILRVLWRDSIAGAVLDSGCHGEVLRS
jgi:hypothetical protein